MFANGHILLPTDFSHYALHAMNYALAFARRFDAKLHIVHVIDSALFSIGGSQGVWLTEADAERVYENMVKHAESRLDALVQQADDVNVAAERHVVRGNPPHALGETAKDLGCGLVIIATHGRTGIEHFVFGSVAEKVIRESPIPVLCVKHPEHEFVKGLDNRLELKRILFPTDFSQLSAEGLPYAADMARVFGAKLTLVYVNELAVMLPEYLPEMAMATTLDIASGAQRTLEEMAKGVEGVEVDVMLRTGVHHAEIIAASKEIDADMIVLPTHGRSGLSHAFFGSVAERVVRNAKCPVLTVRPAAFAEAGGPVKR